MMFDRCLEILRDSDGEGLTWEGGSDVLTGLSGEKLVGLLQRLTGTLDSSTDCYLEVGVFQGLTLLETAGANPGVECYGIDNFAFFDKDKINLSLVESRRTTLGIENAHIINLDYELAFSDLQKYIGQKKIGVYFVDGPHDYRSQIMCLMLGRSHLKKNGVILVDDSNYEHVRQANSDFLATHTEFALAFEAYTPCHPQNMTSSEYQLATKGWWNGVNVIVHDPEFRIVRSLPATSFNRENYLNEHIVHAAGVSVLSLEAMAFVQSFFQLPALPRALANLVYQAYRKRTQISSKFSTCNTYSDMLPKVRVAELRDEKLAAH